LFRDKGVQFFSDPANMKISAASLILSSVFVYAFPCFGQTVDTAKFNRIRNDLVRQGEKIALATCGKCHFGSDDRLSGARLLEFPKVVGKIVSANITRDERAGIGKWTGAQLAYFIRTGKTRNSQYAMSFMPRFPNISDTDLLALVSFLKSDTIIAKPSSQRPGKSKLSIMGRLGLMIKPMRFQFPSQQVPDVDSTQAVSYGEYLVNDVLHCFACHSRNPLRLDLRDPSSSPGYMAGGQKFKTQDQKRIKSPGLNNVIQSRYTLKDFTETLRTGQTVDHRSLEFPMTPYPMLTDNEIRSIYEYIRTVKN
jgi:mono/diheme cytochrome c family protein